MPARKSLLLVAVLLLLALYTHSQQCLDPSEPSTKCTACEAGRFLSMGRCLEKIKGCLQHKIKEEGTVEIEIVCIVCQSGYVSSGVRCERKAVAELRMGESVAKLNVPPPVAGDGVTPLAKEVIKAMEESAKGGPVTREEKPRARVVPRFPEIQYVNVIRGQASGSKYDEVPLQLEKKITALYPSLVGKHAIKFPLVSPGNRQILAYDQGTIILLQAQKKQKPPTSITEAATTTQQQQYTMTKLTTNKAITTKLHLLKNKHTTELLSFSLALNIEYKEKEKEKMMGNLDFVTGEIRGIGEVAEIERNLGAKKREYEKYLTYAYAYFLENVTVLNIPESITQIKAEQSQKQPQIIFKIVYTVQDKEQKQYSLLRYKIDKNETQIMGYFIEGTNILAYFNKTNNNETVSSPVNENVSQNGTEGTVKAVEANKHVNGEVQKSVNETEKKTQPTKIEQSKPNLKSVQPTPAVVKVQPVNQTVTKVQIVIKTQPVVRVQPIIQTNNVTTALPTPSSLTPVKSEQKPQESTPIKPLEAVKPAETKPEAKQKVITQEPAPVPVPAPAKKPQQPIPANKPTQTKPQIRESPPVPSNPPTTIPPKIQNQKLQIESPRLLPAVPEKIQPPQPPKIKLNLTQFIKTPNQLLGNLKQKPQFAKRTQKGYRVISMDPQPHHYNPYITYNLRLLTPTGTLLSKITQNLDTKQYTQAYTLQSPDNCMITPITDQIPGKLDGILKKSYPLLLSYTNTVNQYKLEENLEKYFFVYANQQGRKVFYEVTKSKDSTKYSISRSGTHDNGFYFDKKDFENINLKFTEFQQQKYSITSPLKLLKPPLTQLSVRYRPYLYNTIITSALSNSTHIKIYLTNKLNTFQFLYKNDEILGQKGILSVVDKKLGYDVWPVGAKKSVVSGSDIGAYQKIEEAMLKRYKFYFSNGTNQFYVKKSTPDTYQLLFKTLFGHFSLSATLGPEGATLGLLKKSTQLQEPKIIPTCQANEILDSGEKKCYGKIVGCYRQIGGVCVVCQVGFVGQPGLRECRKACAC